MVNEEVAPSTGRETGRTCERKISKSCRSIRVKYRRASSVGIGNSGFFSLVVQYPEAPRDTTTVACRVLAAGVVHGTQAGSVLTTVELATPLPPMRPYAEAKINIHIYGREREIERERAKKIRMRATYIRARNKKLTSGFLFLFLLLSSASSVSAADVVGGWQASSSIAGAGTWRCIIPAGFDVLD